MSNNMVKKADDFLNKLIKSAESEGIATAKVDDGRILLITKDKLVELLDMVTKDNKEYVSIFIKTPEVPYQDFVLPKVDKLSN